GEQEFYSSRGLMNEPGRCPSCRAARRASGGMGGGGSAYGGSRGMGGPREFFTATCSNCGGEARVPFQPRGDKPVYCSSCFAQPVRLTSAPNADSKKTPPTEAGSFLFLCRWNPRETMRMRACIALALVVATLAGCATPSPVPTLSPVSEVIATPAASGKGIW